MFDDTLLETLPGLYKVPLKGLGLVTTPGYLACARISNHKMAQYV